MKINLKKVLTLLTIITTAVLVGICSYFLSKNLWSESFVSSSNSETTEINKLCGDGVCQKQEQIKNSCPEDCLNQPSDKTSNPEKISFVVIHMEPGTGAVEQKNLTNPKNYWPNLVDLVTTADKYNVKLTLLFNPEWATYILEDSTKLSLLRNWEANGHEIGYHQHSPQAHGMNYWNGYTNQTQYQNHSQFQGTIEEAMALLTQLPADGKIYTAGVAGEEDRKYDWPTGVPYRVDGTSSGAVGTIKSETIMEQKVLFLQHQIFIPGGENTATIEEIEKEIAAMSNNEYLDIVFHAHNFTDETKDDYEQLFKVLEDEMKIKTVKDLLG